MPGKRPAGAICLRNVVLVCLAVVVVLSGGAYAVRSTGLMDGLFGSGGSDLSVYVVRPVDMSITVTEDGELKPKNSVQIKCEVEGQSTILSVVEESTQVKKGDLLIELASDAIKERLQSEEIEQSKLESAFEAAEQDLKITLDENESTIRKCEIDRDVADLELQRYLKGDYQRSLMQAKIAIKQTEMDIVRKKDELEKKRALAEKGFVTATQLDQLVFELEKAEDQLQQNNLQLSILEEYELPKNEKQKRSQLEQAIEELERQKQRATSREKQTRAKVEEQRKILAMRRERVERLRTQYEKCKIYAPVDGVVQYPTEHDMWRGGGNRVAAGEKVYESQTLLVLPDTSQMVVETRIHEADRHKVGEGLPCLVTVPAVPDHAFTGKISRIARFADTANRWLNPELKEHTTEILLDETDAPISPGDSAEIKILIEELSNVLAVPVQCVFSRGSADYVFVRRGGGDAEHVEVALGRTSERMVEIVGGLSEGDHVLMHVGEELLATLPSPSTAGVASGTPDLPAAANKSAGIQAGAAQAGKTSGG